MSESTSARRVRARAKPKRQSDYQTPPLPNVVNQHGEVDFLDSCDLDREARVALSQGMPEESFDWAKPPTDAGRARNLATLRDWQNQTERKRHNKRRNRSDSSPSDERKHDIAQKILQRVESELSAVPVGQRDERTRDAIYDLGKFVNEGYLSEAEVTDAIVRAARVNGLAEDRGNGGLTKVKRDVPRGLTKAESDRLAVDWTRFDALYDDGLGEVTEADSAESADEFDEDDTPRLASKLLTRSDLRNLPKPEPLIEDVLDRGAVDLLYGRHSSAKTFLALDWAASVATGRKWQGNRTTQCRVLYVVAEGAFGFDSRVDAWESGWHTVVSDEALSVMPLPVNLTRKGEVNELAHLIRWGGYEFIVLDTLARCMVGAEENSAKDVGVVVDAMNTLRQATPGTGRGVILGLHHAGKDGKTLRGSSAFESAADTVYFASRDEDNVVTVQREKRRDGPEHDLHTLRLDLIEGTGSGVLSAINLSDSALSAADTATTSAAKLLSTFMSAFGHVGASKAELRNVADMPPATFHRSVNKLVERRHLVNTGTEQRPFYVAGQQS